MLFGGDSTDVGRDIVQTIDGGFSIMGSTRSYSQWVEAYHLKINASGGEDWYRNWGQINDQEALEHVELPTGEFMSIGYTRTSGGGGKDMFLLKSATGHRGVDGGPVGSGGSRGDRNSGYPPVSAFPMAFLCAGVTSDLWFSRARMMFIVRRKKSIDEHHHGSSKTVEDALSSGWPKLQPTYATLPITPNPNPSSGDHQHSSAGLRGSPRYSHLCRQDVRRHETCLDRWRPCATRHHAIWKPMFPRVSTCCG